jgi:hypothetical protein
MQIKNTSHYPDAEVVALVEVGMQGVDTARLAVHVKNYRHAYRGRAYNGVPSCSPCARQGCVDRLVTIGIGAPEKFPCDNLITRGRWRRVTPGLAPEDTPVRRRRRTVHGRQEQWLERWVVEQHPYGGKRAPRIEVRDWREAIVAVAAHEARHVWQYQCGQPRSEVDCERFAAARLQAFREATARRQPASTA